MEIQDLYDKNRQRLKTTIYRGQAVPSNCYILLVHICIFNDNNQMLICQRQTNKEVFPNFWSLTAAGAAISGEDSEAAIKRELKEETSIDLYQQNLKPKISIMSDDAFNDIYSYKLNLDINQLSLNAEEVKAAQWASKEEILAMINQGEFVPYHSSLIDFFFYMQNNSGMKIK